GRHTRFSRDWSSDVCSSDLQRPDAFQFIVDVPTDWEQSIAVAGEIGDFVAFARKERDGADWYLGALTDENPRSLSLPLTFLDEEIGRASGRERGWISGGDGA